MLLEVNLQLIFLKNGFSIKRLGQDGVCGKFFQTPAGVAKTNNPIESFNKQIKIVYTNYELYSIHQFLLIVLQKVINQYSYQPKDFCYYRSPCYDTIKKANEICDDDLSFH